MGIRSSWLLAVGVIGLFSIGCSPSDGQTAPEFHTDIAPILAQNCVNCHADAGIAPFPLSTFEQVQAVAPLIKEAVKNRTMPPFLADNSGDCNTYKDALWLDDSEIDTIVRWVDQGTKEGAFKPAPEPGKLPSLAEVDTILQMEESYTPNDAFTDDYRCFVVDPGFTEETYLRGYETIPGADQIVHHVIVYGPTDQAASDEAIAKDVADPGPGYTCFGGPGVDAQHVAGWAPGVLATYYPEGTGIKLEPGLKLVMQVHYNLNAGIFPDVTTMNLDTEKSVTEQLLVVPLADTSLALAPGQDYVETVWNFTMPPEVPKLPVYGVFPHMHELGATLHAETTRGGNTTCLVDVPRWDFNWQRGYEYTEPLDIMGGDNVKLTCGYNTSNRTETVYWGDGTQDEMCLNYIMLGIPPGFL